ncbi:hypothetical protein HK098_001010 [Nowakowskiella sp. JEL0407]|nr:hypothetical protein HK098_001010 [Nowakowskiella sp. JEL0407]
MLDLTIENALFVEECIDLETTCKNFRPINPKNQIIASRQVQYSSSSSKKSSFENVASIVPTTSNNEKNETDVLIPPEFYPRFKLVYQLYIVPNSPRENVIREFEDFEKETAKEKGVAIKIRLNVFDTVREEVINSIFMNSFAGFLESIEKKTSKTSKLLLEPA